MPSIGFNQSHLRIEEGDTTAVCITSCSCTVQSNFTVELKARNQIDSKNLLNKWFCLRQICLKQIFFVSCTCSRNFGPMFVLLFHLYIKCVVDDIQDDLRLPTVEVIEEGSMCFNVTAIEDDILEGFEVVYIELRNPGEEKYDVCPDKSVISVLIADNDGMCDYS